MTMHQKNPNALNEEYIYHSSMIKSDRRYSLGVKKRTWTRDSTEYNLQAFYYQRR